MAGVERGYEEFKAGWPVVLSATLGIGLGLSPVPFYTIGILAPHLHAAFGWSFAQIFAGVPVTTISVILFSPFVGLLADKVGVRLVALVSVVLFSLTFMGFALSNGSLALFYVNYGLLAALGVGTLPITWTRAVNNRFERRKGFALGLSLVGTGVFGYLVQPFTYWIISSYGWRAAYLAVGALPLCIAFPVALFAFHDAGPAKQSQAERRASEAARRQASPGLTARAAFMDWRFWLIGVATLPISFTVGGVIPNMQNILKLNGFTPGQVVQLASLIGLSVVAGRTLSGWLLDRFWAPLVALVLLGVPASACWMLADGHLGLEPSGVAVAMLGFAAGIEADLIAFLVARYFGMKSYGAIYGALYGFFSFGAGIGPVVLGYAFDTTHSFKGSLLGCGLGMFIGVLMLLALGRYRGFSQPAGGVVIAEAETIGDTSPA